MSKIYDKLESIHQNNQLIRGIGSILGSGLGALISADINPDGANIAVGSIAGGYIGNTLSDKFTADLDTEYNKTVFGTYHDLVYKFIQRCYQIIDIIGNIHNDFNYEKKKRIAISKYDNIDYSKFKDESLIKNIRKNFLIFGQELLDIIFNYTKEKRSHPDILDIYNDKLLPEYQLFKKYFKDSKVIIEHIYNLIQESIMLNHKFK